MRRVLLPLLLCLFAFTLTSCKTTSTSSSDVLQQGATPPAFDSLFLQRAGENAVRYFYEQLEAQNALLEQNGAAYRLVLTDARDPRLYPAGAPIQPPTPADRAVVRAYANGRFLVTALIIERPGYFLVKSVQGGHILDVAYAPDGIAYTTALQGLVGSVNRSTSGAGWQYLYYLKGHGNQVPPTMFDQAIKALLDATVAVVL